MAPLWRISGILAGAAAVVIAVGAAAQGRSEPTGTAPARTTLSGIAVEGRSAEQVRELAAGLAERLLATPLVVRFGTRVEKTTPARLGAVCDTAAAVAAVLTPPRPGNPLEGLAVRFTGPAPRDVALPVRFDPVAVRRGLARFAARIGGEPREPRLTKVDGKFKVIPPTPGRELDTQALASALEKALSGQQFRAGLAESLRAGETKDEWLAGRAPVDIPALTRPAAARITAEHLEQITARLASFSTSLAGSSRDRTGNIRIACRAIDGKVLLPGDVFSYNEVVGPRLASDGYKEAPVIVNGEVEPGLAGGICQVSSTLYNLALLADLAIVKRRPHALVTSYLPAGRDATVAGTIIDFRFRNSLAHPVAVDAKVVGNRVVLHLYGHPDDKREVQIISSGVRYLGAGVKTVPDPRLPKGRRVVEKRARSGRSVTITRVVKKDGVEVRRERVSRDYYPPKPGIVRVGTRETAKPAPAAAARPPGAPLTPAPVPAPAADPVAP
jgi:vancomycin resistance protein YoaR